MKSSRQSLKKIDDPRGARRPGARDQDLRRAHELEVTERQPVLHHGISFLLR
jgi:hypothetical protein